MGWIIHYNTSNLGPPFHFFTDVVESASTLPHPPMFRPSGSIFSPEKPTQTERIALCVQCMPWIVLVIMAESIELLLDPQIRMFVIGIVLAFPRQPSFCTSHIDLVVYMLILFDNACACDGTGPIVLITLLVGFGRHYLMSSMAPKKSELVQVMEAQALMRSRIIAANGKFLTREAFEMRRQYFVSSSDPDGGFFKRKKRDVPPPNPMQDPSQMNNMMMVRLRTHDFWHCLTCLCFRD